MDWQFLIQQLRQFIFTMANNGHWVFLGTLAITVVGLGPIGRGLGSRLRSGKSLDAADPTLRALRGDLAELSARQDFAASILVELKRRGPRAGRDAESPSPVP